MAYSRLATQFLGEYLEYDQGLFVRCTFMCSPKREFVSARLRAPELRSSTHRNNSEGVCECVCESVRFFLP